MLTLCKNAAFGLLHLFYPHTCAGCGDTIAQNNQSICLQCFLDLPETNFQHIAGNAIEKIFYGRLKIDKAMAGYFFSKDSSLQHIIHAFKYERNTDACLQMGKWLGLLIQQSSRMEGIDCLIPMPIHDSREKKRGYNQAAILCEGIQSVTGIPFYSDLVVRMKETETQTRKSRMDRWQNVHSGFMVKNASLLAGKHILLVDDVITTGATLEACGEVILKANPASLSITALAWASE
jgi:ComF family protein